MPGKRKTKSTALIPAENVQQRIHLIRGQRVILDSDLAQIYGVTTKRLNEQVRRNAERFPGDFMFQLTLDEAANLKLQNAALNAQKRRQMPVNTEFIGHSSRSQIATLNDPEAIGRIRRGENLKYRPYAFTEHGALMAATVLNSPQAVAATVFVVRAFVKLREVLATHHELAAKFMELESKVNDHDEHIVALFEAIRELMHEPDDPPRPPIGFQTELGGTRGGQARRPPRGKSR